MEGMTAMRNTVVSMLILSALNCMASCRSEQEASMIVAIIASSVCFNVQKRVDGLTFDGCNTGKYFAFDCFKQCATTSADVANLVGQAELGAACYAVTATDE